MTCSIPDFLNRERKRSTAFPEMSCLSEGLELEMVSRYLTLSQQKPAPGPRHEGSCHRGSEFCRSLHSRASTSSTYRPPHTAQAVTVPLDTCVSSRARAASRRWSTTSTIRSVERLIRVEQPRVTAQNAFRLVSTHHSQDLGFDPPSRGV